MDFQIRIKWKEGEIYKGWFKEGMHELKCDTQAWCETVSDIHSQHKVFAALPLMCHMLVIAIYL